jgi:hypothetical protein
MISAVVLLMAGTLLTTTAVTTMAPAAYAGRDNDDGNKQKAEDESQAALADCDENDVERAGFDCIAIAASDVEIESPEESATLSVCKGVASSSGAEPDQFDFTVTGNNPSPAQFEGDANCVAVTIGPGEFTVSEVNTGPSGNNFATSIEAGSDCVQDPLNPQRATGEIQAGETQECIFFNFVD